MPVFLVDLFGSRQLEQAFLLVTGMTVPVWLCLILAPNWRGTKLLGHPFFVPALLVLVWLYLLTQMMAVTGLPTVRSDQAVYHASRALARHPFIFLVAWAQIQIANLFVGCVIYQEGQRRGIGVPGELLMCAFFGPLGLLAWLLRLGVESVFRPKAVARGRWGK